MQEKNGMSGRSLLTNLFFFLPWSIFGRKVDSRGIPPIMQFHIERLFLFLPGNRSTMKISNTYTEEPSSCAHIPGVATSGFPSAAITDAVYSFPDR